MTNPNRARCSLSASGELLLYGHIGEWADGLDAASVVDEMERLSGNTLIVRIHSSGGYVLEGLAIYNRLKQSKRTIHIYIDGMALSMASVVAMAGDKVFMPANALMMVHKPWNAISGNADDLRDAAVQLDKLEESILAIYQAKTGLSLDKLGELLAGDGTWLNGREAHALGLVDHVIDAVRAAASIPPEMKAPADKVAALINHPGVSNMENNTTTTSPDAKDAARVQGILSVFAQSRSVQLLDQALVHDWIAEGITEAEARQRVLGIVAAADAATSPRSTMRTDSWHRPSLPDFRQAAADALAMRHGIPVEKPHAAAADLRRMSLVDLAEASLRMRGISTSGLSRSGVLTQAMNATLGGSTSDFPLILSDLASKALLAGYGDEPDSTEGWTSVEPIANFKTQNRLQLSEAPDLDLVRELGEYKHGAMSESNESFRIHTYGKIFSLSREAMVNDDLSAFTRTPRAFGQAARRKELDTVWGIVTSNPTMSDGVALFHSTHSNLVASGTALSVASLGVGRAAMRKQKGLANKAVLNVVPRYLLVPAALETTAEQLIASLVDPTRSNDTANLEFIRGLQLRVDARLDATSATAWFLASDPGQMETIVKGYLDGQRGVQVELQPGFEVDGIAMKARLDFGAAPLNHRGLYKNPGA